MKIFRTLLFFLAVSTFLFGQNNEEISSLQNHYESFEYSSVISKAEVLLLDKERFSEESLIQIYELKAASHFAMGDQQNARKSFIETLKINDEYELNNVIYSPKLVDLFTNVKDEFLDILNAKDEKRQTLSESEITSTDLQQNVILEDFHIAVAKSLIIPGWGHLQLENSTKGWILTSVSTVTLGSMIYFVFDANSKEKDYLAETNANMIKMKYDDYDKSYKIRNSLIAAYAAVWLYSQIDLLFFSNNLGSKNISLQNNSINNQNYNQEILFSVKIPF